MEVLRHVRPSHDRVMRGRGRATLAVALAFVLGAAFARAAAAQVVPPGPQRWPVKQREHVDLWLHGFAMVAPDSSTIPLYRRDYRDALLVARNSASASTDLDASADALRTTLRDRPGLVGAQFLAFQFGTWADLESTFDLFVKSDGNPRAARDAATAEGIAAFAQAFRTREERDFAKRFVAALRSERDKFHHQWWVAETRRRDAALAAVDSLWQLRVRPKLQPFLNHIQQRDGQVILSPVLEGEGRTVTVGKQDNTVACGLPVTPDHALDSIHCLLHELVGALTAVAVEDNVTPAEKRNGVADKYQSIALVRGGAMLAAKLGPDYAEAYMRFYLRVSARPADGDLAAAFARAFPLPEPMEASIARQVAVAFGGI
jgi:hypothetical protein